MATAHASLRYKEVALRKVCGTRRIQLASQFTVETIILALGATLMGLVAAGGILPALMSLQIDTLLSQDVVATALPSILLLAIGVGVVGGLYPAIILSGLNPLRALKGTGPGLGGRSALRKILVFTQFSFVVLLVLSMLVIEDQLAYLLRKDLGFDREQIVMMPIFHQDRMRKPNYGDHLSYRYSTVKAEALAHPSILKASAFRFVPGAKGGMSRVVKHEDRELRIRFLEGDPDFLSLLGLKVITGRNFTDEMAWDGTRPLILNETAAKLLGVPNPVGRQLEWGNAMVTIIGVVPDFHTENLGEPIHPTAILWRADVLAYLGVKVNGDAVEEALAHLEGLWKRFLPERPFEYRFLDDALNQVYERELVLRQQIRSFSLIAVLLGAMGLLGLSAFAANRRKREVVIRKTVGASATDVVVLLSREFGWLVLASNAVAIPVGAILLGRWLNTYAYHVDLHPFAFCIASLLTLGVALSTIAYHALPAAREDPIHALRSE